MRNRAYGVSPKGILTLAAILLLAPSASWCLEKVQVRHLAEGKKVIPVTCRIGHWQITDIKLPDLVVTNRKGIPVTVEQVEVIGSVGDTKTVRLLISGEPLSDAVKTTAAWVNKPTTALEAVQLSLGNVALPEGPLLETLRVPPGRSVLLPLSKIAYLHHVGHNGIDAMEIRLTLRFGGRKAVVPFPVELTPYAQVGSYHFPLKGDLQMAFLPMSYIHHRASASQEFAMDLVSANQEGAQSFTDISRPHPATLSDYGVWGRDVLAMGDGVVVETGGRFPEARMSDPALFTQDGYVTALLLELIPQIGWTNAVAGNYVVLDHRNGEFSVYCHLQEGSIQVEPGQSVSRGQVVARVGNTGNSGAPHLHFQLQDSADFFTANGLPMTFGDVPVQLTIQEYPVVANTLTFSDSVFHSVP